MYHANDEKGDPQMVVVGVNSQGEDMVNGIIADKSWSCPTACDNVSPLYK
jgi:hypothetical protein